MKEIKAYKCEFCGKVFMTPDRHDCKYNPEKRNCFTCGNNRKINGNIFNTDCFKEYDSNGFEYKYIYSNCIIDGYDDYGELNEMASMNWDLRCGEWVQK